MGELSVAGFVARWQAATFNEKKGYQQHFLELCEVLEEKKPAEADAAGTFYTFEKRVDKSIGGHGFADVWMRGHFAWEYKGPGGDLAGAYQQLKQYMESLENPPLMVVCDFNRFEVHTNFTNTVHKAFVFTLADLIPNVPTATCSLPPLEVLRALFREPERLRPQYTPEQVTKDAATEFARLAEGMRKRGVDPEEAAHFLMQLLFCLFAEDVSKLLPDKLFSKLLESTRHQPDDFNAQVRYLFGVMSRGGYYGPVRIPQFNGGLFGDGTMDDRRPTTDDWGEIELTGEEIGILLRASKLDWASVEPAIFGTLFERSLDPAKRSQLGAHYTSKEDILLIVEPVLMEPLRRRWEEVKAQARGIIEKREATQDRGARTRYTSDVERLLLGFTDELSRVRVLDPACGSGNFLYVALKKLLDLEKEVSVFGATSGLPSMFPKVDPSQLYGIEINAYAHELASVVVWIGYLQWLHDNGFGFPTPPILKRLDNIEQKDAILGYDEEGRAVEPEWPEADVIIGNPPFLGGKKLRGGLGDRYLEDLFKTYAGRVSGEADLVTYWFDRGRATIEKRENVRVGLIGTNSIRQGANRLTLERIKATGDIFIAWSDRPWVLDGADVRVSIVGFDAGNEGQRILDGMPVEEINADLTATIDLTSAKELSENVGICLRADEKGGAFDIPNDVAQAMLRAPVNVNGRFNSDVILRWITATDITRGSRNMWIIDFGADTSMEDASEYEQPFAYVEEHVKPERQKNNMVRLREKWWLHRIPGKNMRNTLRKLDRYIATPVTSKYRVFVWVDSSVLPDITAAVFARSDDYFFGVLQSRVHELWSLRRGGWMGVGNDPRYTPTSTFETFPFPWPPGKEPQGDARVEAIGEAARELVEKRDRWLNPEGATVEELKKRTLTNLYNARPTWLDLAHKKLDRAVMSAYGWQEGLADEEVLGRLLALNLERAGGDGTT